MSLELPEPEWKALRKLHSVAIERYCKNTLTQVQDNLSNSTKTFHDQYLALYRFIESQDKEISRIFDNPRRSTALILLANIYTLKLITEDEFNMFSIETREKVLYFISPEQA